MYKFGKTSVFEDARTKSFLQCLGVQDAKGLQNEAR